MAAVKAGDVERSLRQHDRARHPVALFYGPDAGLVSERAKRLAEAAIDDPGDPFQLIRMDGETLAADPSRLADEASTIGLFGGRRCLWVRATRGNIAPAVTVCLDLDLTDTTIVIEAGDLARTAPLRVVCEKSPKALALPCYADNARDLADLTDTTLRDAGLSIGAAERAYLLQSLGGDRMASRNELTKLVLYAHGQTEIGMADIDAVISDVSGTLNEEAVDAAFSGRLDEVDEATLPLSAKTGGATLLLGSALRHALQLLGAASAISRGGDTDAAIAKWRGLHFSRRADVTRHVGLWSESDLAAIVERLQAAILDTRRQARLSEPIASRALMDIARQAHRQSRRR